MLIGEKISKQYKSQLILNQVDVSVKPGRITVVMGPSGSGKSTLVRALALLEPIDGGEISLDGIRVNANSDKPWPKVMVVFQQLFLWPHLTLRENILLPTKLNKRDSGSVSEIIQLFGMSDFIDRYPNQVSGGEKQRAALARAVILNPTYILLDEITSAVDVEQTGIIMNYLVSLRDKGIGLLVVTHLLGFARRLLRRHEGDQFLFLDKGVVVESGDIGLLESPKQPRLQQFLNSAAH